MKTPNFIPLNELFPYANEEKLAEIDLALTEQVKIAWDIWTRVEADPIEFKKLLAMLNKFRAWENADVKCRCSDCHKKFDQDYASAQAAKQPVATTPETTPVV